MNAEEPGKDHSARTACVKRRNARRCISEILLEKKYFPEVIDRIIVSYAVTRDTWHYLFFYLHLDKYMDLVSIYAVP